MSVTTEIIGNKQCPCCSAELFEADRFCRRCGIVQSVRTAPLTSSPSAPFGSGGLENAATRPLGESGLLGHSYSGVLLGAVTRSLSERTSGLRAGRPMKRFIISLLAIPLWLMIVLLSPLDAFAAARVIAREE